MRVATREFLRLPRRREREVSNRMQKVNSDFNFKPASNGGGGSVSGVDESKFVQFPGRFLKLDSRVTMREAYSSLSTVYDFGVMAEVLTTKFSSSHVLIGTGEQQRWVA